jgi:uncharacterized protein YbjT (DUF2867 family)
MGRALLTGATGYAGARLLGELERRGLSARCLARRPAHLAGRVAVRTEFVAGNELVGESIPAAFEGVESALDLVDSMGARGDIEEQDRRGRQSFVRAANAAGVRRNVYLGGLGVGSGRLSPHLRSHHEVGESPRAAGVSVIELRASIVIGERERS